MAEWRLESSRPTLHGHFSRSLPPVLIIDSGDTVVYGPIPDAAWNSVPALRADEQPVKVCERNPELDGGHCLVGPVAIRGAEPGMTVEIHIDRLIAGDRGWTVAGGWSHEINDRMGFSEASTTLHWSLDPQAKVGINQFGHKIALNPFFGVIGMPPDQEGRHPTAPPRRTGGNLDCKELVEGVSLFLPIEVPGGLISVGDGHAAQGDGEVCVTAVECPIAEARLTFTLHPDLQLKRPRARVGDRWIVFGLDENLDEAALQAVEDMSDLIAEQYALDRLTALAFASLVADFRVTQIVNGVKGVHAILKDRAIQK
jgi:acetamidase/formamidase